MKGRGTAAKPAERTQRERLDLRMPELFESRREMQNLPDITREDEPRTKRTLNSAATQNRYLSNWGGEVNSGEHGGLN
jgi:hypothetical protein